MFKVVPAFADFGDPWDVDADLLNDLGTLTCALFGTPQVKYVEWPIII